jgi:probable rRNA maturation factor
MPPKPKVTFENRQRRCDAAFRARVRETVRSVAAACWEAVPASRGEVAGRCRPAVHVVLAGPRLIRAVNRETRGVDAATDVLSFPMLDLLDGRFLDPLRVEDLEPAAPSSPPALFLGDVLLGLDRAVEQAARYGHSVEREVAFLAAHGILHLLGYDHPDDDPAREARMRRRQREVLARIGCGRDSE